MFQVTLIYEDGTSWFAGGFPTLEAANAWINEEKTRKYWKESTVVNIVEV